MEIIWCREAFKGLNDHNFNYERGRGFRYEAESGDLDKKDEIKWGLTYL